MTHKEKEERIAAAIAEAQRIKKQYSYEEKAFICRVWRSASGPTITFNFGHCQPLQVGDMIDNNNGTKSEVVAIV